MSRPWQGAVRAVAVLAVGGALVAASSQVPGTLSLGTPLSAVAEAAPRLVAVQSASLSCPGPETEGLANVPPVAGVTTVLAAAAPAPALAGVDLSAGPGRLGVQSTPSGTALGQADQRAVVVSGTLQGASVGQVTATGSLAPGTGALQTWLQTQGDDRALVTTPCTVARADQWLVAGGGESTRRERLVVTNPGANSVSADVTVLGAGGPIASANGKNVAVPPHGRVTLLLDALVGPETTPVVHVAATGGVVTAVLQDSWIDGAVGRGADDATPTDDPATEQVIPAAFVGGPSRVRIGVPGSDESVVQVRVLTAAGPQALPGEGVVRVPAGAVRDVDLSALPAGAYAVQVRSDHPVVAGAMLERRGDGKGQSDFAWTASTAPIPVMTGTPLPAAATGTLMLVGTGAPAGATVVTVSAAGAVASRDVPVSADGVAVVDVSGLSQVWVLRTAGTLRAGVALTLADQAGAPPLFSIVPLGPLPVSVLQVPAREVRR